MAGRRVAALALPALCVAVCGCGSPSAFTSSSVGVAGVHIGTPSVTISATDQLTFDPATQNVTVGEIVEWKNTGSVTHNIVFAADSSIGDPVLESGGVWQVKFTAGGTYQYSCTIHTGMVGTITVSSG